MGKNLSSRSVLVIGSGDRAGLEVIRSLGRADMIIDSVYFEEPGLCEKSRYLNEAFFLGNPVEDLDSFSKALINQLICKPYDLVFPINDLAHQILYNSYHEFSKLATLAMPVPEVFKFAHDKVETYNLCRKLEVPVPKSEIVENFADLRSVDFSKDKYFKPESSVRIIDNKVFKSRVRKLASYELAEDFYRDFCAGSRVLVQEAISGVGLGVNVLAAHGDIKAITVTERLHEPINGGAGSYRLSKPVSPILRSYATKIIRETKWTGLAMLEFKRSGSDYYLMEINGRAWGSIGLSIFSGVDFPRLYAEQILFDLDIGSVRYSPGRYTRNLVMDIKWSKTTFFRFQVITLIQSVMLGCIRLILGREKIDEFDRQDLGPMIAAIGSLPAEAFGAVKRSIGSYVRRSRVFMIGPGTTNVIGSSGFTGTVLFVCKGNINRSAFAAAYLAKHYGVQCESAGTLPRRGRLASRQAIKVAGQYDVDLTLHESSYVGDKALDDYSRVVVFDHQNMSALVKAFPEYRHKMFFLSNDIVHDPFGYSDSVFEAVFQQIKKALDNACLQ